VAAIGVHGYSDHIDTPHTAHKEIVMNVLKHMEAAFIIALAAAGTTSLVAEAMPFSAAQTDAPLSASIGTPTKMAVVTVTAKRLTPAEKERQLRAERALGSGA